MASALPYVVAIQLLLTLGLAVLVFALARQVGVLHERIAPMGAMTSDHGPAVGELAPPLSVLTLGGSRIEIGGPGDGGAQPAAAVRVPIMPGLQEAAADRPIVRERRAPGGRAGRRR